MPGEPSAARRDMFGKLETMQQYRAGITAPIITFFAARQHRVRLTHLGEIDLRRLLIAEVLHLHPLDRQRRPRHHRQQHLIAVGRSHPQAELGRLGRHPHLPAGRHLGVLLHEVRTRDRPMRAKKTRTHRQMTVMEFSLEKCCGHEPRGELKFPKGTPGRMGVPTFSRPRRGTRRPAKSPPVADAREGALPFSSGHRSRSGG
jgi:hypothetical protein